MEHIDNYSTKREEAFFERYAGTIECFYQDQGVSPSNLRAVLEEDFRLSAYRMKLLDYKVHSYRDGVVTLLVRIRLEAPDEEPVEEKRIMTLEGRPGEWRITNEVSQELHACFHDEEALKALEMF